MDALEELDRATARYRSFQDAQVQVQEAIAAALRAGKRPSDVARRSPFTAAYVRRIARACGIEGDQRYVRDVRRTAGGGEATA